MPDRKTRERFGPIIARVREQAAEFVARETDVRRGDASGVHRMRVAVRRLRGCLEVVPPGLRRINWRRLDGELLSWIGGLLGAERDAEVIEERISHAAADLPGGVVLGSWAATGARPDSHATSLVEAMDSDRYRALVAELAAFAISPPLADRHRRRRWLEERVVREIVLAEKLVAAADRAAGDERNHLLHEVRKSAKRIRYAAESLVPAYGEKARRIADAYEEIQTILGEHHDAVVTAQVLTDEHRQMADRQGRDAFNLGSCSPARRQHWRSPPTSSRAGGRAPPDWCASTGRTGRSLDPAPRVLLGVADYLRCAALHWC